MQTTSNATNPGGKWNIAIYLFFALCIAFVAQTCKAQTTVFNFEEITAPDTATHELQFKVSGANQQVFNPNGLAVVLIQCDSANVGGIQFAVAQTGTRYPINASKKLCYAGWRGYVTVVNGLYNLFYKAENAADKFMIIN